MILKEVSEYSPDRLLEATVHRIVTSHSFFGPMEAVTVFTLNQFATRKDSLCQKKTQQKQTELVDVIIQGIIHL